MAFITTPIEQLLIFEPSVFEDSRGYFFESYNEKVFTDYGLDFRWVQDNQSSSMYGVVRGLHLQQPPYAQTKLVRVLRGKILDVAVDLRKNSPTYGQHFAIELSDENKLQLLIPKNFAHGFSVLSDKAEVLYKCDSLYKKDAEDGVVFNDEDLLIDWKIPKEKMIVAEKDLKMKSFKEFKLKE